MSANLLAVKLVAILCITCAAGSEIGVPVLLWQKRSSESPLAASQSTATQIDANVLADDYIGASETVVAFVQKKLSLEQFTTEDETKLTAVKNIFDDHSIKPTLLLDVLDPVRALPSKHFPTEQLDQIVVRNGDKVTIELPNDSLAKNNELLAKLIADIQKNVSKDTLFLITGRKNEFQSIDLEENIIPQERFRRAAEEPDKEKIYAEDDPNLVILDDEGEHCFYLYTTKIIINTFNLSTGPQLLGEYYNFTEATGKRTVDTAASHCWKIANVTGKNYQEEPAYLKMLFTNENNTELTLEMTIHSPYSINKTGFWYMNKTTVGLKFADSSPFAGKGGEFNILHNQTMSGADIGFGYSCGQQTFLSEKRNLTDEELEKDMIQQISIRFLRFQLQPFKNPYNQNEKQRQYIFTESFDCEVWFTLPLWMGLLTLLVLFVILFMGVYFVSQINTPDRFENPKGKPLVIANVDE